VRAAAARGLGERGDTDSADALLAVAFNDDAVGAAARMALRLLPTSRVDDALIGRVAAGPVRERAWSVEVLAGRGYRPLVPVLLDTGFLEDPVLRSATMEAWRQLAGEADVPGMLAFALRVDAGLRGAVAAVVGQVVRRADDPAGVVRALDLHLRGATAAVRAEMLPLYALVPGPEAVASLALQAGAGDAEVRRAAVRALARHGSAEALRALHALSADPEVGAEARALLERRP
jgi:HEAT repeat protein